MKRLFIITVIVVVVLNVGVIVYSEYRTRQTIAEIKATEPVPRTSPVSVAPEPSPELPQAKSTTEFVPVPVPETEKNEDYVDLESLDELDQDLVDLIVEGQECCPEDDKEAYLSWEQKVRKNLTEKHGAIPQIDRYIELTAVYRDGGVFDSR